ncbi:MAG: SgcJ/EcaC family oxidoreductase [Bryobacteraceae bacterium]
MRYAIFPVLALTFLSGCSSAPTADADHRDEALKQVQAAEIAAGAAFIKHDAELFASMYAPDALLMLTNTKSVTGDGIKAAIKQMMADTNLSMTFHMVKVEASKSGDLGYVRGTYTATITDPKTKKTSQETGSYVTVYAKQPDGTWKITEDITTPDGSPAGAK